MEEESWPAYKTRYAWGTAASPIVHEGRLYIVNDNDDEAFLAAFDKMNGKEIWRVERDEKSNWATPYLWKNEKRTEIITCGTRKVRSYDLDGRLLWELGPMSSITIPTPFSEHGLLYITSGYVGDQTRPVFAVRPGASGDISLKVGRDEQRIDRLVVAASRALQSFADRLRRPTITLCSIAWFLHLSPRQDRRRGLRQATNRSRRRRLRRQSLGPTTERSSA